MAKSESRYVHLILYAIIVVLVFVLIKVAYLDPNEILEQEKYYKKESRFRMSNIRAGERLWEAKYGRFTDNIDSLVLFLKNDPSVKKAIEGTDSITHKSTNPFVLLTHGLFEPDSLLLSPKSRLKYVLQIDTTETADTIIDRRGRIIKIEKNVVKGTKYFVGCPDGYGTIGDVRSEAMKHTASWE